MTQVAPDAAHYSSGDSADDGTKNPVKFVPTPICHPRPKFKKAAATVTELRVDPGQLPRKAGRPRNGEREIGKHAGTTQAQAPRKPPPPTKAVVEDDSDEDVPVPTAQEPLFMPEAPPAPPPAAPAKDEGEDKHEYTDAELVTVWAAGLIVGLAVAYGVWRLGRLIADAGAGGASAGASKLLK